MGKCDSRICAIEVRLGGWPPAADESRSSRSTEGNNVAGHKEGE